jgi:uncharacterized membrane protein YdbT with pleckstrin-like domain
MTSIIHSPQRLKASRSVCLENLMPTTLDARQKVGTGMISPHTGEVMIREVWPSVTAMPAAAALGQKLICSIVLAPLGWLLLLPIYFLKILPFVAKRYTLTNRRLMIRRGLKATPTQQAPLDQIDDVRLVESSIDKFYRSATLEILSGGNVILRLPAVPQADSFRHAILDTRIAWAPHKS